MYNQIKAYLQQALGVTLAIQYVNVANGLPRIIADGYEFFAADFENRKLLFANQKTDMNFTPLAICKHTQIIQAKYPEWQVVYAVDNTPAYQRQRLINYKIPFIVPGKQIYLPFMGTVLTETSKQSVREYAKLGRMAQEVILAVLNNRIKPPFTIVKVAEYFDISLMTGTVAFDELEYFNLAKRVTNGNGKQLCFHSLGLALWREALPLLENPIRRVVGLSALPDDATFIPAGETRLSKISMLGEPPRLEYAIALKEYRRLPKPVLIPRNDAPIVVQLWLYPPTQPGETQMDILKLFLSFKNEQDERIQIELEKLIGAFPWPEA